MAAELLLALHVAAGSVALVAGPVAYLNRRRRAPAMRLYFAAVVGVAATALGLVGAHAGRLWWLAPLALLTAALAQLGRSAGRPSGASRARAAAHGWGGSYIALVTALTVVSISAAAVSWILPTVIGVALIELHVRHGARLPDAAAPH